MARALVVIVAVGLVTVPAGPQPAPGPRLALRPGVVASGVALFDLDRSYASFLQTTGQHHVDVFNGFVGPDDPGDMGIFRRRPVVALVSKTYFDSRSGVPGTLRDLADGAFDDDIVEHAAVLLSFRGQVLERIHYEQTGHWFDWAGYSRDGRVRPGNAPADFIDHWRRIRILYDGGRRREVDARLAAAGLPPYRGSRDPLPSARRVELVWHGGFPNPRTRDDGTPIRSAEWYPGDDYVDWVATDLYGEAGISFASLATRPEGLDDLYDFAQAHGKPMMLAEWGLSDVGSGGSGDDAEWMEAAFDWMQSHDGFHLQVYFNIRGSDGVEHRLEVYPRGAAVFRARIRELSPP